jgi:hypothetical protein
MALLVFGDRTFEHVHHDFQSTLTVPAVFL